MIFAETMEPQRAAEKAFQSGDFWWKRIERVQITMSWPERVLNELGELIAAVFRAFWNWLSRIFEMLFRVSQGDWSSGSALVWLVAGVVLAWALWKFYPVLRAWLARGTGAVNRLEPAESHQLPEAVTLFQQARQALAEGRYADAIRFGLLALLARLQREGLLRYDPARTNREYFADLSSQPRLADLVRAIARPYERVWYGRQAATQSDAQYVLDSCETVVTEEGPVAA